MITLPPMEKGDLLQIEWADICENSVGDPRTAKLARRTSFGLLWEVSNDDTLPVLVTTTTIDKEPGQEGYCIYPLSCITSIEVVKRGRKKSARGRHGRSKGSPRSSADIDEKVDLDRVDNPQGNSPQGLPE